MSADQSRPLRHRWLVRLLVAGLAALLLLCWLLPIARERLLRSGLEDGTRRLVDISLDTSSGKHEEIVVRYSRHGSDKSRVVAVYALNKISRSRRDWSQVARLCELARSDPSTEVRSIALLGLIEQAQMTGTSKNKSCMLHAFVDNLRPGPRQLQFLSLNGIRTIMEYRPGPSQKQLHAIRRSVEQLHAATEKDEIRKMCTDVLQRIQTAEHQ